MRKAIALIAFLLFAPACVQVTSPTCVVVDETSVSIESDENENCAEEETNARRG